MRPFALLLLVLSITGCAHRSGRTVVLSYDDLGPQVAVFELIGFQWYQWEHHGDSRPGVFDNIRVVVYDGLTLKQVQQQYPVVRSLLQDYRYLSFRDALAYIDSHVQELPHLANTRARLVAHFGKK